MFHLESTQLILTDSLEVLGHTGLGCTPKRRVCPGVKLVLIHHGIEHATLESLLPRITISAGVDDTKHPVKQITRFFLHGAGHRAIKIVTMQITPDAAAPKIGSPDQRRHHARRESIRMMRLTHDLID